jgi:hypothetical protein
MGPESVSSTRQFKNFFTAQIAQIINFFSLNSTWRFVIFSVITNIYNKKTKEPTLMELFTATGKVKKVILATRDVRLLHYR